LEALPPVEIVPRVEAPVRSPRQKTIIAATTFFKAGAAIAVALIVFQWVNSNTDVRKRIGKVSTEVWIGLVATGATTYWKWYSDHEAEKIATAQNNAAANSHTIKAMSEAFEEIANRLQRRIDSLMLQMSSLRASQTESAQALESLNVNERALDEKIDQYRYDVLKERLEIVKSFYSEISDIHAAVNYLKGFKEGDRSVSMEKLSTVLEQVAEQIEVQLDLRGISAKQTGDDSETTTRLD
jgi:hypothetical protein